MVEYRVYRDKVDGVVYAEIKEVGLAIYNMGAVEQKLLVLESNLKFAQSDPQEWDVKWHQARLDRWRQIKAEMEALAAGQQTEDSDGS